MHIFIDLVYIPVFFERFIAENKRNRTELSLRVAEWKCGGPMTITPARLGPKPMPKINGFP